MIFKQKIFILPFIVFLLCILSFIPFIRQNKKREEQLVNNYLALSSDLTGMINEKTFELEDFFNNNIERFDSLSRLSKFFESPDNDDLMRTNRIRMFEQVRNFPLINELVFYRYEDNRVASTSRANVYLQKDIATDSFISNLYEDIAYILNNYVYTEPNYISVSTYNDTEEDILIYVHPVLNYNHQYNNKQFILGYAFAFINKELFFETDKINFFEKIYASIIYNNENILYETGDKLISKKIYEDALKNNENLTSPIHLEITVYNESYKIYLCNLKETGFTSLIYMPSSTFNKLFFYINYDYIFIELIIIIISFISIFTLIKKANKMNTPLNTEEQSIINHELQYTKIINLLHDVIPADDISNNINDLFEQKSVWEFFSLLVIEPNKSYINDMSYDQKNYFNNILHKQITEYFDNNGIFSIGINDHSTYLTILINMQEKIDMYNISLSLLNELNKNLPCGFNIFYLPATNTLNRIGKFYSVLTEALNISYIYKYSNIFSYEQLMEYGSKSLSYHFEILSEIKKSLKNGGIDKFKVDLSEKMQKIINEGCLYKNIEMFLFNILRGIFDYYKCKENYIEYIKNHPMPEPEAFASLDDFMESLFNYIDKYSEDEQQKVSSINEKYMEKITEYIHKNIEVASLTNVADTFNMSSSYLSRIFKETLKVNFIDYVSLIKIEKAANMLISEPTKNINDIAQLLGYEDPAYFSKKFKSVYDLSPSMYRKSHMVKEDKSVK